MDESRDFDIALSFAGEDRAYVDAVAHALHKAGIRVFYDRFEEANLWGKDLYVYLSDIYQKRARFTVMFISDAYGKKRWTNHEREAAQARAFTEAEEYILPARFDNTEIPGVLPTTGYVTLKDYTPEQLASIIVKKLTGAGNYSLWQDRLAGLTPGEMAMVWAILRSASQVTMNWLQGVFGQDAFVLHKSLLNKHILADAMNFKLPEEMYSIANDLFIDLVADEIQREMPELLMLVPMIDTRDPEDSIRLRWMQVIGGVGEALHKRGFSSASIVDRLHTILENARVKADETYLAGNLINLLASGRGTLSGLDLSALVIRHAYLRNVQMQDACLVASKLVDCVLADTFGSIWQVGFRAEGSEVLASSVTGQVRVWSVDTWTTIRVFGGDGDGHNGWSFGFAVAPGEVASAGGDGEIRVWHENGKLSACLQGHLSRVRSVAYLPDRSIVSCSEDKIVFQWVRSFSGPRHAELYRHADRATTLAVNPQGSSIASGAGDGEIVFCPVGEPSQLVRRQGHQGEVRCVRYSDDGLSLVSVGDDHRALIWDVREARIRGEINTTGNCKAACFLSGCTDSILLGDDSGFISIWQPPYDVPTNEWAAHSSLIRSLASSPGGQLLASGGDDQTLHIWRNSSDQTQPTLLRSYSGYLSQVRALAFAKSGQLASGHDDGQIRLWDPRQGSESLLLPVKAHHGRIWSLAFWQSGELLVSAGEDGEIHAWRHGSDRAERSWRGHDYRVFAVATRDAPTPIIASGGSDKTVRFWCLDSDKPTQTIGSDVGHVRRVRDVTFNRDGTMLASVGEDGQIILWTERNRSWHKAEARTENRPVTSARFMPKGNRIVYVTDAGEIIAWDYRSGAEQRQKLSERPLLTVTIDPHGITALAGSESGHIFSIALEKWESDCAFRAHDDWVEQVLFSPDGSIFATASDDQFIGVYDSTTRKLVANKFKASLPYQGLRIDRISGIGSVERSKLLALGAVENQSKESQ